MRRWTENINGDSSFTATFNLEGDTYNRQVFLLDNRNRITSGVLGYMDNYDLGLEIDELRIDGADERYWYHPKGFLTGGEMTRSEK